MNGLLRIILTATGLSAAVAETGMPDPLIANDGTPIGSAAVWRELRRPEILELFRTHVYGRAPVGRPDSLRFEVVREDPKAISGTATLKVVRISASGPGGSHAFDLILHTPNHVEQPAPCFLFICNRGPQNIDPDREEFGDFWPIDRLIARGYAGAAFYYSGVVIDHPKRSFDTGFFRVFDPQPRPDDAWGAVAAWAWGASRALDYLETDSAVDASKVAIVGHSRGGKAALWAGAEDERFAMVVSNDSGSTGAAIARDKRGERIADITRNFPHWFSPHYRLYAGHEDQLPVDQHMLAALIAPRLLYIASASEDIHSDPAKEYQTAVLATPVYELLDVPGLVGHANHEGLPPAPLLDGHIGYHVREGPHDLTAVDWRHFLDFAARHLRN